MLNIALFRYSPTRKVVVLVFSIAVCVVGWNKVSGQKVPNQLPVEEALYATTENNLADCIRALSESDDVWCEMRVTGAKPGISNVWPSPSRQRRHQNVGPSAVLTAWNSAAYDPIDKVLYFFGGGHADYGGNEVYSFALETGAWKRLTAPSSLDYFTGNHATNYYWIPDTRLSPASAHTYDGMMFNTNTRTIILLSLNAANGARLRPTQKQRSSDAYLPKGGLAQQYEFNPSHTQTRNGLASLTWRRIGELGWSYPRSAELAGGKMLLGSRNQLFHATLDERGILNVGDRFSIQADYGDGNVVYDSKRNLVWSVHSRVLLAHNMSGEMVRNIDGLPGIGKSLAFDLLGNIVSWDGGTKVYRLNPDEPDAKWHVADSEGSGPINGDIGRVYGKWVHVGDNYFVGVSSSKHGVWVYNGNGNRSHSQMVSALRLQPIIDSAKPGSTVTLPPGLYGTGLEINKQMTVNMQGVELRGVAGGKAVLVIEANGPVVINDFSTNGKKSNARSGNIAGIRISGSRFDVTLNNAHIVNTAMGLITDNRGGHLKVRDSTISGIGRPGTYDALSHVLYAGEIDYLEINNTILQNSRRLGHILKSRAKETLVRHSQLLGLDGNHSRVIDFPCGGRLVVEDSILQSSTKTDNSDMISVGVEAESHCSNGGLPGSIELKRNTIVFDRGALETKLEHKKNPNRLFTWKGKVQKLIVRDNIIVYPAGDPVWHYGIETRKLPDFDALNNVYNSRASAGLAQKADTPP